MTKHPTKEGFATRAIYFGYEPAECCGSLTPSIF